MNNLVKKPAKYTYPTLKEVFIDEISYDVAHNFVKRIANRHNKEFYKKLAGIAKIVVRLYEMGMSPTEALERMESIFRKFPELNPEKDFDSIGIKMFIQTMIKHKHDSGNAKRFYDNVVNALLRTKYKSSV